MTKGKKFKGNNAKIVGDTRLTQREMKKMQAAYHNVQRDNADRLEEFVGKVAPGMTDLGGLANLGMID